MAIPLDTGSFSKFQGGRVLAIATVFQALLKIFEKLNQSHYYPSHQRIGHQLIEPVRDEYNFSPRVSNMFEISNVQIFECFGTNTCPNPKS